MRKVSAVVSLVLRTYPTWWRDRYEDEVEVIVVDLMDAGQSSMRIAHNLLSGSWRARLSGVGAPASREFWTKRTRTSLLVATLPWFALIPLFGIVIGTERQYDYSSAASSSPMSSAGELALGLQLFAGALFLTSFCVALFGWLSLRDALHERRTVTRMQRACRWVGFVGLGLVAAILFLGLKGWTVCHSGGAGSASVCSHAAHGNMLISVGAYAGVGLLLIAWAVMPFTISRSVRSSDLSISSLRTGSRVAVIMTSMLTAITTLVVASGFAILAQPARPMHASYLVITSTLGPWFLALSSGLVVMTAVSLFGTLAARRSFSRAFTLT